MKLKTIFVLFLFAIIIAIFTFAKTVNLSSVKEDLKSQAKPKCGDSVEGFSLCAKTEKQKFEIGEAITLHLILKNITDEDKEVTTSNKAYKTEVKLKTSCLV